jgi:predicted MFS family arabinose efflux permease
LKFAVGMARSTYVSKIAEDPSDMTPTFSLGISINHAVSMTVPWFGGMLWVSYGYSSVFLAAAGFALLNSVAALFVRVPRLTGHEADAAN